MDINNSPPPSSKEDAAMETGLDLSISCEKILIEQICGMLKPDGPILSDENLDDIH